MKWITPWVHCDSCKIWYHQDCMGMSDQVYLALRNVSLECIQFGLPNISSCLFDLTLFETTSHYDSLSVDAGSRNKSREHEISFSNHRATSFPKKGQTPKIHQPSTSLSNLTIINDTNDQLLYPSFMNDTSVLATHSHQ